MGRQEDNRSVVIQGFDPGDRWVGCATLVIDDDSICARARVLDRTRTSMSQTVDAMMIVGLPMNVRRTRDFVCENYRSRPQGFNRFTQSGTARLIGGLQYCVEAQRKKELLFIEPGSIDEVAMLSGEFLDRWHAEVTPLPHWEHALSAWRVVFRHILNTRPALLERFRSEKVQRTYVALSHPLPHSAGDIVPVCAKWRGSFTCRH